MKKKYILIITIIISFALIGLVSIQVYWINNAIILKKDTFRQSVTKTMARVVHKLEKIEMAEQIRRKTNFYERSKNIIHDVDSINLAYYQQLLSLSNNPSDSSFNELLRKKSSLFNDVFEDMFAFSHFMDIEKRINMAVLDSLIHSELVSEGIETEYEFGIYSASRDLMVFEKTGRYSLELLDKSYGYVLYPTDMYSRPDYLMLYFPHEQTFLLIQMAGMLIISVILILVIIISFFLSINSMIKQRRLTELKTDFINNMTHEFKTPVSTIALACEALMDNDIKQIEGVSDNYIQIIRDENRRLGTMAEKILQTAVLEKGKLKLNKEPVNIHEVIDEVIKNIGIQVEINDGTIVRAFNAANPVISADRHHLTNIIFNLLENANKYSPKKPCIVLTTTNVSGGVEIAVKDNGIGISKADQQKIFDKLYRVPSGNVHDFKGFGLGLNYVKAIIDKHSGRIRLESEINKGSTFTIFLPEK